VRIVLLFFGVPGVGAFPADAYTMHKGSVLPPKICSQAAKCVESSKLDCPGAPFTPKGRQKGGFKTSYLLSGQRHEGGLEIAHSELKQATAVARCQPLGSNFA
jgi:hypothetical protein